jgi:hypothetical protein
VSLRYEWAFDVSLLADGLSVTVTDSGGAFTVSFTSGTYAHTSINSVVSGYTSFAAALETALNAGSLGAAVYNVDYAFSPGSGIGYTIECDENAAFDFTGTNAQVNMRRVLGFTTDSASSTLHESTARPYYLLVPSIQGRSNMSDEMEPDGASEEEGADDGTVYQTSKDTSEVVTEWTQMAEPTSISGASVVSSLWAPPFERQATSLIPWSYQHAFRHARTGHLPFLVVDGSDSEVHELRADGTAFRPTRFASPDFGLWSIPFRTRLLGRL